ncbi:cytochrome P450 [Nocardia jiangxiensis]|uniref:Cytochrome P450 n=1 Tax=Nocardia jiangxiensis TaxID=282685 RepID=A0ABW6SAP2_9NOCA|nr:cytochrome P450 [Nocardia jiangxiensis]
MTTDTTHTARPEPLPLTDPAFRENPYPWYETARRDHPIFQDSQGTYVVSRYADVIKFANLSCMSIEEPGWVDVGPGQVTSAMSATIAAIDPPRHTELRRHTNRWFTPKLVKNWAKITAEVTGAILDRLADGQVIDGHRELGIVPTHATMCRVLQLPDYDVDSVFKAMFDAMTALSPVATPEEDELGRKAWEFLTERVSGMLAQKRSDAGDGMADALVDAHERGEITADEMLQTIVLFYGAGHQSPGYLVASGLEVFARDPAVFEAYKQQPAARNAIVNEILRLYPPELSLARFPTEDIEIHGVAIPAQSRVRFMIAAANRDPEVFHNPHQFDYTRPPETSQNLTFGIGAHGCAGQVISRAEAATIFTTIAERYERVELVGEPTLANTDRARAYFKLPIRLL